VRRLSFFVVLAALAIAPVSGQQSEPFRSRADLVSLYATVTDATGELVPDLTKDDFAVFDDGKRQPISVFSNAIQPITIIVMLDRSGSMAEDYDFVREAAGEFVGKLLPNDRARIGSLSREILIYPATFTSDQRELRRILKEDLQPAGPSPIWTSVDRSITALLKESGRRVVLLFTDGHDAPERGQVHTDVKDVMRRAQYDGIMLYAIGVPTAETSLARGRGRGRLPFGASSSKIEPPDPNLRKLAGESGGGYFELDPMKSLAAVFGRVADELHHQYELGFPAAKLDGNVHKLEVRAVRPGLVVRARKAYVADPQR
jgi:Ca-activated chloride channel family protein